MYQSKTLPSVINNVNKMMLKYTVICENYKNLLNQKVCIDTKQE